MKKGKYENTARRRRRLNPRFIAMMLALCLLVGASIGGTIAWLTDTSDEVKNTFTTSDVDISLDETTEVFKMIPGNTIEKDPKVTVKAVSEACWLFVKVEASSNLGDYITYAIADGWTALDDTPGVYYREVADTDADQIFSVLADDEVTVKDTVTKTMMNAVDGIDTDGKTDTDAAKAEVDARPSLTFTAYAVQLYKNNTEQFTAAEAWAQISTN